MPQFDFKVMSNQELLTKFSQYTTLYGERKALAKYDNQELLITIKCFEAEIMDRMSYARPRIT
jgi:hypothetical protein